MKLSTLIVVALGLWFAAASAAHSTKKVYGQISLEPGLAIVPVGLRPTVCASSALIHINVNHLKWMLRNRNAKLKLLTGMPANCREYIAPTIAGWDRITVHYRYGGNTYYGQMQFGIPAPVRP